VRLIERPLKARDVARWLASFWWQDSYVKDLIWSFGHLIL